MAGQKRFSFRVSQMAQLTKMIPFHHYGILDGHERSSPYLPAGTANLLGWWGSEGQIREIGDFRAFLGPSPNKNRVKCG
jgi:hypothetical protein